MISGPRDGGPGNSGPGNGTAGDVYASLRPLLFAIAYRMVASVGDAEDIVQDAFLRYHRTEAEGTAIESPRAFLSTVTTRLSIDHLRSARVHRETYTGPWLPEPLLADPAAPDPARHAEDADSLSMAFLLLLERLSPVERAVFLLHDVFGYGYPEVAGIVGRGEDNCRQLALRARRHVTEHKPRFEASAAKRDELASRFFAAIGGGDMDDLVGMLAQDVVVYGDGGGTRPSWPRPIAGRANVIRLLRGVVGQWADFGIRIERSEINGQPGAAFYDAGGGLTHIFCLEISDGVIQTIRSVINPAKLGHLGPLSDLGGARGQPRPSQG